MSAAVGLFGHRAPAAPVAAALGPAELRADHLMPADRLRRGHRVFTVMRVAVSTDEVAIEAQQLGAAGSLAAVQTLTLAPGEICRLEGRVS